jgi:hypothetical protein
MPTATMSVVGAVIDALQSFTNIPNVYSFDVPVQVAGTQIYPPYVVVRDNGTNTDYDYNYYPYEQTDLEILVYANTLAACEAIVEIVKYNGGSAMGQQGLDFGQLPSLATNYANLVVERKSEQYFAATATGNEAQRISGCRLRYIVALMRKS